MTVNEAAMNDVWKARVNIFLLVATSVLATVVAMTVNQKQEQPACTCDQAKITAAIKAIETDVMLLKARQIGIGSPIGSPVGSPE